MKKLMLGVLAICAVGFGIAKWSESKPVQPKTIAVDCYDKAGNILPDEFAKFGGVQTACAPGQTTKLRATAH